MTATRAGRIRNDPRKIYTIVPVPEDVLDSSPCLLAAFKNPGLVIDVGEAEDKLLRDWLRESNPKRMGNTLFVDIDGNALKGTFQVHHRPR